MLKVFIIKVGQYDHSIYVVFATTEEEALAEISDFVDLEDDGNVIDVTDCGVPNTKTSFVARA